MIRTIIAGVALAPLFAGALYATTPIVGTEVGDTESDVSKALEGMGFDVITIGIDEGIIEVEVTDGDDYYDVEVDPETGLIVHVEVDLDNDGDA